MINLSRYIDNLGFGILHFFNLSCLSLIRKLTTSTLTGEDLRLNVKGC